MTTASSYIPRTDSGIRSPSPNREETWHPGNDPYPPSGHAGPGVVENSPRDTSRNGAHRVVDLRAPDGREAYSRARFAAQVGDTVELIDSVECPLDVGDISFSIGFNDYKLLRLEQVDGVWHVTLKKIDGAYLSIFRRTDDRRPGIMDNLENRLWKLELGLKRLLEVWLFRL